MTILDLAIPLILLLIGYGVLRYAGTGGASHLRAPLRALHLSAALLLIGNLALNRGNCCNRDQGDGC